MWKPALENRQPASQYISTQWLDCEQSLFIFAWDSGRKRANCDCEFVVARLRAARTKGARLSLGLRPRSSRFEASPHVVSQLQIARFLPLSQRKITTRNRKSRASLHYSMGLSFRPQRRKHAFRTSEGLQSAEINTDSSFSIQETGVKLTAA